MFALNMTTPTMTSIGKNNRLSAYYISKKQTRKKHKTRKKQNQKKTKTRKRKKNNLFYGCLLGLLCILFCVFPNIYCPHGPQWSSFDKSILLFIFLSHDSRFHLPNIFLSSFINFCIRFLINFIGKTC